MITHRIFRSAALRCVCAAGALIFLASACTHSPSLSAPSPSARPPNIIIILIDTLSADHMSAYGYPLSTTPFLSKFAAKSLTFENAFSLGGFTLPSHYSIITGTSPATHKIVQPAPIANNILDSNIKTLTEVLKDNGYFTFWTGQRDGRFLGLGRGLDRGFSKIFHRNRIPTPLDGSRSASWPESLKQLRAQLEMVQKQKLFLFFHTYMVHGPYLPASPYDRVFAPYYARRLMSGRQLRERMRQRSSPAGQDYFRDQFDFNKKNERLYFKGLYDGGLLEMDGRIEQVFQVLEELDLYDNSIIILTSDHGEAFFEHGNVYHDDVYYEQLHVPLMVKLPGVTPRRISTRVLTSDLMPTILHAIGLRPPIGVEGRNLLPLIDGGAIGPFEPGFIAGNAEDAFWDGKWKLILSRSSDRPELYDTEADLLEKTDVSAAYPAIVDQMRLRLNELRTRLKISVSGLR